MGDLIERQQTLDALDSAAEKWNIAESFHEGIKTGLICAARIVLSLPSAEPEPSIPLSWFDEQIEMLKGLDNAFATLTALQISGMVKKWCDEQNG